MARIKDSCVAEVKAAADIVEVVSARTSLRRASSSRFTGRCPFHEERTPSFSVDPVDKLYYCFGCGKGGDVVRFVQETREPRLRGAIEWLAERFRVPLEYEESSPQQDAARRRKERLTALLDQATAYFERVLWETETGAPVREYLAARGLGEEIAKEFRLGLSRGSGLVAKARESGFSVGGDPRGRPREPARQRLLPVPADVPAHGRARPRDRVPGAAAARRRPAQGEVRQHARERALQEGQRPVRPPPRAARRSRSRTGRSWSRATPT